jgi:hypothetical protein
MQATQANIDQYHDLGYTLIKGLIPQSLTDACRARTLQVVNGQHDWPPGHFQLVDPAKVQLPDGKPFPGGIQRPGKVEQVYSAIAEHPNLQNAMAALLGDQVQLFTDQCLYKSGRLSQGQAGRTFYHQDSWYWKIDPSLGCNCWIPFDHVGKDAIALAVIPGSQKGWKLTPHESYFDEPAYCDSKGTPFKRHRVPLDQVDYAKEVLIPMAPGDGLFFTNYTWHRSEPNYSGQDKIAYAIAYQLTPEAAKRKLEPQNA